MKVLQVSNGIEIERNTAKLMYGSCTVSISRIVGFHIIYDLVKLAYGVQ